MGILTFINPKKFSCCLFAFLIFILIAGIVSYSGKGIWNAFYSVQPEINTVIPQFPGIGTPVTLPSGTITIQRIEHLPSKNPTSDFQTLHVEALFSSNLPVNTLLLSLFTVAIEDEFGNTFTLNTADRRNNILKDTELPSTTNLLIDFYFLVPTYSTDLYLVITPKLDGTPSTKIKLQ